MTVRILISMSDDLFAALEQAKKQQAYMTNQELINSCVRRYVLDSKKNKGGRPRTLTFEDAYSRDTPESRRIEREMK